ncbi:MAG: type I secretion C-terminal target domain-containing protein [Hyphomicrobiaceae bacterium]
MASDTPSGETRPVPVDTVDDTVAGTADHAAEAHVAPIPDRDAPAEVARVQVARTGPQHAMEPVDAPLEDEAHAAREDDVAGVPGQSPTGPGLAISPLGAHAGGAPAIAPMDVETIRWGRDDLNRHEMGSEGHQTAFGVGTSLGHLVGLGDEEPGARNGETVASRDSTRFTGESTDIGAGLEHLWLLGDTEYYRASTDDPEVIPPFVSRASSYGPLSEPNQAFDVVEDRTLTGRIFDPTLAILPVSQRTITTDPAAGTATFDPDGTFTFVPAENYSGVTQVEFSFIDPRTGLEERGTITITVEAVADPALIQGSARTLEDTAVATPITVTLADDDGSEDLESVVLSGIPTNVAVAWNTALPGAVTQMPDGSLVVTGSTAQIQDILASLSVTPPRDYHGTITFDVAATTIEANVAPGLPGYRDRETVHFQYHVDVEAVADLVTATGDSKTTDEDIPVHLDQLAATFGDSIDGSETHLVEIRGVAAGAKLLTGPTGTQYTYTVAGDGTHTYALPQSALGNVWFAPPKDESGLFSGMTIVAIATETSNGDREIASAPIQVQVDPVADPVDITAPAQTTDEDTPVTFGDDIAIVVRDPGSQTLTQVEVSGFPAGTVVTYTPVGSATPITVTMTAGGTIVLTGGTEAQIRAALQTLTLTPPQHTDQNFSLSVSATTTETGGLTDTQSVSMPITVAAVADGPTISGNAAGDEDQPISLPVTASRIDADGSEQYDFATITVPTGVSLLYPATLPNGVTVGVSVTASGTSYTFTPGATTTAAQFESVLATGLQVQAPADSDANFDVAVKVGTIESVLSGGEVSVLRKDQTASIPVTVHPVVDMPTVGGSSAVDEDNSVDFGADIVISQNDHTDGSEAITRIVLGNIPAAATVNYTAQGAATVTAATVAGITTYTISGGTEADIRNTLATFSLQPALHSDVNIPVSVAITKVDRTTSEGEAASTATQTTTHDIAVAAVADGPSLSGSASGNEDQAINLPVTVSRFDADGSEQYDFATITIPSGVTLLYSGTLPNGITVSVSGGSYTFTPGPATTAAQFESFLATGLQVHAPADSDVNFDVSVKVGTIESVLSGGEVTLLRADRTITVPVSLSPVIDAPTITGSSTINEDGIVNPADQAATAGVNFGANIGISAPDGSDGSEAITQIVVSNLPVGAIVTYTPIGGVSTTFTVTATSTSITLGGGGASEAEIRTALASLSLVPPPHGDADISLGIAVTKSDATATDPEAAVSQTFNGTHTIQVAAVADVPTLAGSASGSEDQNISFVLVAGHPDDGDGSETIKNVVIAGVPAGFALTESSTGAGILTLNPDGSYTVSGASDAAINDVLAHLTLAVVPAVGGPRQHLDTDFSLSVAVTTIESAPSESGSGQVAQLETTKTFSVPVTVTAVADGVSKAGASVLVEDVTKTIGGDISWTRIDSDGSEHVTSVTITGIPAGTTVRYTDLANIDHTFVATGAETITLSGPHSAATEAAIRSALDTLTVTAAPNADANFTLGVAITTTDNDASSITQNFTHSVVVQAVADAPAVSADNISLNEDAAAALVIRPDRSADDDNSETLSLRITVPADGSGTIGTLSATAPAGITFTSLGSGVYTVTASGATAAIRETALDTFLDGGITFTPRTQWSGVLTGTNGIKVEAISTEAATLYGDATPSPDDELAPNDNAGAGTGGDLDTRTAIATTYIDVTVAAVADIPTLANTSTTVNENNNATAVSDPDLVIALGARLGMTLTDADGSQGLSMTLTGLPTNAQAIAFAASMAGVTTTTNIATGTVTISGANASNVLSVLASLSVTLADDDDRNVTVAIDGTATDTNGTTPASSTFSLSHVVTVKAVADLPTVNVGTATKAAVEEDSGFVTYPVTTGLNDTDGSETYQSVVVSFSTPGSGARPEVQFGTTSGVTFDTSVPGQVTLTGAAADIDAAMATLQIRPGANNGEDISVTVTATSVESLPSEDNNGASPGIGGGVAGPEISVPTAQTTSTFVIPVNPVPEFPTLSVSPTANGVEDTTFALGTITVTSATVDPDGSETRYIEIDTTSIPTGTAFSSGGATVGSVVTAGWLRIPESAFGALQITPPANYSGQITLSVRGVIVDGSSSGSTTATTAVTPLTVTVAPVADGITAPGRSTGVEDINPIAFGATLSSTTSGIRPLDNGTGTGNNTTSETLARVVLDFADDTPTLTYAVTAGATIGSAVVDFNTTLRTYTITSTIITGAADPALLSQTDRAQAETDIRATLAGFTVAMGPTHSDVNGGILVTATTLDVNGGVAATLDSSFNHSLRVQAVADTPTLAVVDPVTPVSEDGANIALTIDAGNSVDTDNSETLSVRITVPTDALGPVGAIVGTPPAGVTLADMGGGVYLVTASGADNATREALLDGFLNGGGIAFDPRSNWSGSLTGTNGLKIEAISTEAANGNEVASWLFGGSDGTSKTETVVDYIDIVVSPVADAPSVKGNAVGLEDSLIRVPMSVTLGDKDGSETYVVKLTSVAPAGTHIYGAGGIEILPVSGVYTLSPADVAALAVRPPANYSSALGGNIVLTAETTVTDTSTGGTATTSIVTSIDVSVTGVADAPSGRSIVVTSDEDEPIDLGAAILANAGGNMNNLLVDGDGSEQLSFVLSGLPTGVFPTSAVSGGVVYIGHGTWSVSAAAMATLTLPAVPDFSGENPYPGLTVRAITQEMDGDQAFSPDWSINLIVNPIINAGTVDGFASWNPRATLAEQQLESGASDISLASAANHTFVDNDGSETVVSYTFDLNALIADAGIAAQLATLPGAGSGLDKLVANYITGQFTYSGGKITVAAADIAGVALRHELFPDSNQDFSIPVEALVRDTAIIAGTPVSIDKTETASFVVDLVGTADLPTVFASNTAGDSATQIPLTLGGTSTDTDATALGRTPSESIFYVLRTKNPGTAPTFGLVNSNGDLIGLDIAGGSFLLTPAEIADVRVLTTPGAGGTIDFELTTVADENDGDRATNSTAFQVVITPVAAPVPGTPPLPPTVTVGASSGNEDGSITLNVTATPAPGDTTNPQVSVLISNLPSGAYVEGARLLPPANPGDPPTWVASAAAVAAGLVTVHPPVDFSGTMAISIEGIARNASLLTSSSGQQPVDVWVDPVADGVRITASPASGVEDMPVALNISLSEVDTDGSETIDTSAYVMLGQGATLAGGYPVVSAGDPDATVEGVSMVGYYRVPASEVAGLQMIPASNWHGTVSVTVAAKSIEPADPTPDADNAMLSSATFSVDVSAAVDAPIVTVPGTISGNEDTAIALTGLSAALADTVTTNGAELLSVTISGVPAGSFLSDGQNNGDGSWTVPVGALATLSITPPANYSGTMALTLNAIALETSNGSETTTSAGFSVDVAPKADDIEILAENAAIDGTGATAVALNVRLTDDNGAMPGENPPELVQLTFSGVPTGVSLVAEGGGLMTSSIAGTYVFLGTQAEANAISAVASATATGGSYTVNLSAVTLDGTDTLATPVTDFFRLTVPQVVAGTTGAQTLTGGSGTQLIYGLDGDDQLNGGADDDYLSGGLGADTLTGGTGSDTFAWQAGDLGSGVDTLTDFTPGTGGDALDVSALLTGYDTATSVLSDFVRLTTAGSDSIIEIDADGGGDSFQVLATLQNVTGLNADVLQANGNLIV